MNPEYQIIPLNIPEDTEMIEQVVELFGRTVGDGYIGIDRIVNEIRDETSLIEVALFQDSVIGTCISQTLTHEDRENEYVKTFRQAGELSSSLEFIVGLLATFAVDEQHRGKGVGGEFYKRSENFFRKNGIKKVMTIVWESNRTDCSKSLFCKNDFQEVKTIPEYWKDISLQQNIDCPVCGSPPCRCSATLMTKNL